MHQEPGDFVTTNPHKICKSAASTTAVPTTCSLDPAVPTHDSPHNHVSGAHAQLGPLQDTPMPRVQVKAATFVGGSAAGSTAGVSRCGGDVWRQKAQHGPPTCDESWAARVCQSQPSPTAGHGSWPRHVLKRHPRQTVTGIAVPSISVSGHQAKPCGRRRLMGCANTALPTPSD